MTTDDIQRLADSLGHVEDYLTVAVQKIMGLRSQLNEMLDKLDADATRSAS